MATKELTYEEHDAWMREVQLGTRDTLPDGRAVAEARNDVHNPPSAAEKSEEAREQTIEGLLKSSKEELLEMAKNAHLTEISEKNTKQEIAREILTKAEEVGEVE